MSPAAPEGAEVDPASVLVVIPTLDEGAHIADTLDALTRDAPGMERVEIVVADGGSTDDTRAVVAGIARARPNVSLIDNPGRLQAAAVNRAVATRATPAHAILVRVDAHAHYPPRYVLDVAETLVARGADAVATVMDSGGRTCFQRGAAWATDTPLGAGGSGHRGGTRSGWVDHGHHAGFRLDRFREVGGYDETFAANEDAELDHRLRAAGGRIWLAADIRLGYVMRPTLRALARQYWRYGRGRARTVAKHGMRPRARQMIPPAATVANAAALAGAAIWPPLLLVPAAYLAVLAAATGLLVARHGGSACALWGGPALAAMHHAWGAGFLLETARQRRARRAGDGGAA